MYIPKTIPSLFVLAALALFTSGCTTTYFMQVDALSSDIRAGQTVAAETVTFRFADTASSDADDSLRVRQLQRQVQTALATRNMIPASQGQSADVVIHARARISDPLTETDQFSEPVYFRTGGVHRVVATPVRAPDGSVSFIYSTVWIPPRTEFAGFANRNRNVTVFQKELMLSARIDDGSPRGGEEVWNITVTARDAVSDLRAHIPFMLAAALPYIGAQTEGQVVVRMRANDPMVDKFRN